MLYKSKLLTLETMRYIYIYIWFGCIVMSIGLWAQEAVFTHVIDVGTGYVLWVELIVQRRLCPMFVSQVGLPDIHEYSAD